MAEAALSDDPLSELRAHVRAAQLAAERLAREAQGTGVPPTPASGWAEPPPAEQDTAAELRALVELIAALRGLLPTELREQLHELTRQLLLVARALLDWLMIRLEGDTPGGDREVQDIPIG